MIFLEEKNKKKIVFVYPADCTATVVHHSHAKMFRILEKLIDRYDITIIGRLTEKRFRSSCNTKLKYEDFFKTEEYKSITDDVDIEHAESIVGLPFAYIFRNHCQCFALIQLSIMARLSI